MRDIYFSRTRRYFRNILNKKVCAYRSELCLTQRRFTVRKDYLSVVLPALHVSGIILKPPNSLVPETGLKPRSINPSICSAYERLAIQKTIEYKTNCNTIRI